MRIDIVSIFPDYLAPLELSLPGKAREKGLLDVAVHDLREWTTDRHRTVDATPYGGGAGMVMKPEPWGAALAQLSAESTPTIIFTTPSGEPFNQSLARELSAEAHLVFACGRYEGIDQRVIEHAASLGRVREISLGDYVLNGGEVAALAVTEAVVRLLPGFMGNPDSLVEESHEDGLLEYPVYTKPASWQGLEVPPVLLSGDHGAVADWRHSQRVRRTARRRPDLLHASVLDEETSLRLAHLGDAGELMTLQRAWVGGDVARIVGSGAALPAALTESLDDVRTWLGEWSVLVAHRGGRLVAAARARLESADTWDIDRLMIAPDLEGQDLGRSILEGIEALAPSQVRHVTFSPLSPTSEDLRTYKKAGYRASPRPGSAAATVRLRKPRTITD